MTDTRTASPSPTDSWRDLGEIATAHVLMLRDVGIIEDAVLAALLTALDGVSRNPLSNENVSLTELAARFDERVDALTPAGVVGTVSVARSGFDTTAALVRLGLRRECVALARSLSTVRRTLIDLAGQHAATTMPVMVSGRPAQATTLGHYLGGLAAPLGRAASRLQLEFEALNRSPLGAVAMAGTSLPIERERTAELLGFDGPVDNTFDAVVSVDHIVAVSQVAAAIVHPVRRFIGEIGEWIRANPTSFHLADSWAYSEPGLPQFVNPIGLERISANADAVAASAAACDRAAATLGYEPPGQALDAIARAAISAVRTATLVLDQLNDLLATGLEINRAYLANVAGKGHTTTSDLSIFLMESEGLDPVSAANIASMTVNRAIADGIEASGINTQMIDASALMVIGRELAVEFEAISRYLAPRRFLERRTSTGTPSPARTREYLGREEELLTAHVEWIAALERRIDAANRERERLVAEALANVD